jgi:putative transposase
VLQRDALAMKSCMHLLRPLIQRICTLLILLVDAVRFLLLCLRPSPTLAAENLFLRKPLALYQARDSQPKRAIAATRLAMTWLARWFDWRRALVALQPATLIRWPRQGFRLCWRWTSTPGRPPIPPDLRALIRRMAWENPAWGEERMANELLVKLGLRVSPRTVRKSLPKPLDHGRGTRAPSQRWRTVVRNHAQVILACDFCLVVTATFRRLYVFVVTAHATRRILHVNVTAHPTAVWTRQQLRDAMPSNHDDGFLIHGREAIFSQAIDQRRGHLGLRVLKTSPQRPQANALCEQLLGTLRREGLDFLIARTAYHLRRLLNEWVQPDNTGRPHMAVGPGISHPPPHPPMPLQEQRYRLPEPLQVVARPILGRLHHEDRFEEKAA